jgi:F-type H+-transporting ATPase subunit epsilon
LDKLLTLEIVSPVKKVYSGFVNSVSAPGILGEFQILFNHAAMVSELDIGIIKINSDTFEEIKFSVSGGTLEVRNNIVNILAETIESKDDLDVERARRSLERANQRIESHEKDFDRERSLLSIKRAKNRLKLAGK